MSPREAPVASPPGAHGFEPIRGWLAEFATADALLVAARKAHDDGYRRAEAYTPFHVEGLAEALGSRRTHVPAIVFLGGLAGGVGGFFMQWYSAVVDYPIDVGGRPLNSWPMFVPVTFELAVLGGALAAVLALLIGSGLPRITHPLFRVKDFDLATRNRFFLYLRSDDPSFERESAARFLDSLGPLRRVEVPK